MRAGRKSGGRRPATGLVKWPPEAVDAGGVTDPRLPDVFTRVRERLPESLSQVARTPVTVEEFQTGDGVVDLEDPYWAKLVLDRPDPVTTWLGMSRPVAIALAGLLVMMQEKVVREKVEQGDVTDDDVESLAECVGHASTAFDDALREVIGEGYEMALLEGGFDVAPEGRAWRHLSLDLAVGDLARGKLVWLVPPEGFGEGQEKKVASDPEAEAGPSLSPEELAAIREVTQTAVQDGALLVLAPVTRVHDAWREVGEAAGMALDVVTSVFALRRRCREGTVRAVVVDGDVLPGGGVAAVDITRRWAAVGLPVIMAASRPTRRHVTASLAAGAGGYVQKPVAVEVLRAQLDRAEVFVEAEGATGSGF